MLCIINTGIYKNISYLYIDSKSLTVNNNSQLNRPDTVQSIIWT